MRSDDPIPRPKRQDPTSQSSPRSRRSLRCLYLLEEKNVIVLRVPDLTNVDRTSPCKTGLRKLGRGNFNRLLGICGRSPDLSQGLDLPAVPVWTTVTPLCTDYKSQQPEDLNLASTVKLRHFKMLMLGMDRPTLVLGVLTLIPLRSWGH